jgi:DNA-binding NarL/FixJ family response regulator
MEENKETIKKDDTCRMIRVMLVDDHPIVRQGLKDVLNTTGDITVCCESGNANEAIDLINKNKPDMVIADITLDGSVNGIDLVKSIHERFPEILTLVLSMNDEFIFAERAIKAGARGYLMKNIAPKNIIEAIRIVIGGELYLREDLSKKILEKMINIVPGARGVTTDNLSNRELEIFQLIGNGFSIKEIAKKLNLSIYTVESHRRNMKEKLHLKTSADLTKHAIQSVLLHKQ